MCVWNQIQRLAVDPVSTPETSPELVRTYYVYLTGLIHIGFALAALGSGLVVVLRPKGTAPHRHVGRIYAASMIGLNGTALMIYRLFGGFGPFHVFALISLVTVAGGLVPVIRRRPRGRWVEHHAYWMTWSYVGLLAAAVSEITTRVPSSPFWWMVFGSTLLVVAIGQRLISSHVPRIVGEMRRDSTGAQTV